MKRHSRFCIVAVLVLILALGTLPLPITGQSAGDLPAQQPASNASPIFIENAGQFADPVRFQVRGRSGALWLTADALWLTVAEPLLPAGGDAGSDSPRTASRPAVHLRLSFPGANPQPDLQPFERLAVNVSYYLGSEPSHWHSAVPVWAGITYRDLYPGIDLELSGTDGALSLRLIAQPGADPSGVRLRVDGAEAVSVAGDRLTITTALGVLVLPLLDVSTAGLPDGSLAPPEVDGMEVRAPFAAAKQEPALRSGDGLAHASDLPYSSYLGGADDDNAKAIALDGAGNVYLAGWTQSTDFPEALGLSEGPHGGDDVFVAKMALNGDSSNDLIYYSIIGGSLNDRGNGLAVASSGEAYVTGYTNSSNFPTTAGVFDRVYNDSTGHPGDEGDVFVAKLTSLGAPSYSTCVGGANEDGASAISIDPNGNAYVAGYTHSADFPTSQTAFDRTHGSGLCVYSGTATRPCADVFVAKLNTTGSSLVYGTFLGGDQHDEGEGLTVDTSGYAYVAGRTESSSFPFTPGAYNTTLNGVSDAFVTKLNTTASALVYSTFLGSSGADYAHAIARDAGGNVYVTGQTQASDFPTTAGAYDTTYNGLYSRGDAFVTKLNSVGGALVYSTFLGGTEWDQGWGIAVDGSSTAYVAGATYSGDFPTTAGAYDLTKGYVDAVVLRLSSTGGSVLYSTFLGGGDIEGAFGIAVDSVGYATVAGRTWSSDFPVTAGAYDDGQAGDSDAFVSRLTMGIASPSTPTPTRTTSATATRTPIGTATATRTTSATVTRTPIGTGTATRTQTATPSRTRTPTATATPGGTASLVVNTTDDSTDGNCDVTHCSLRDALMAADRHDGLDTVIFSIPTTDPGYDPATGVWTLKPNSGYDVYAQTIVEGTLAGAGRITWPAIEIDGTTLGDLGLTGIRVYSDATLRNLTVNHFYYGIWVAGNNVTVEGCFIGTDATGSSAKPNRGDGILVPVGTSGATIQGNLVSGNHNNGIRMSGTTTSGNTLRANRIGTNAAGTAALANGIIGISLHSGTHDNLIEDNLVSGNTSHGIHLADAGTNGNELVNNHVGTDANGTAAVPNGASGVVFYSGPSNNTLGPGNVIAYNAADGALVDGYNSFTSTVENRITANSVTGDGNLGIHTIRGGNGELAAPVITHVAVGAASGTACAQCIIEVFSDDADEGAIFEGTTSADSSGAWSFIRLAGFSGPNITATARDGADNTSEFSAPVSLTPAPTASATPTRTATGAGTVTRTQTPAGTATRTQTPAGTATRTQTPAGTATRTQTPAGTATRTQTPAGTATRTQTPAATGTATRTRTRTATATPTATLPPLPYIVRLPIIVSEP